MVVAELVNRFRLKSAAELGRDAGGGGAPSITILFESLEAPSPTTRYQSYATAVADVIKRADAYLMIVTPRDYAILRRATTGTFTTSRRKVKATAAASVPSTTKGGNGVIAIPTTANIEAITISATDDAASHRLGFQVFVPRRRSPMDLTLAHPRPAAAGAKPRACEWADD